MIKRIIIIAFIALISSVIALLSLYLYEKSERIRFESNYNISVNDKEYAEILHKGELKKYYYELDTLRKKLNIRDKTVKTVFVYTYKTKDSTVFQFKDSLVMINDTIPFFIQTKHISKPCYDLYLKNVNDTITSVLDYNDNFTGFLHWERPHKFWFVRWGNKQYYLKMFSECQNDTIKVDKLIIQE